MKTLTKNRMYVAINIKTRIIQGFCNANPEVGDMKHVSQWVGKYIQSSNYVIFNVSSKWLEKHWLGSKV